MTARGSEISPPREDDSGGVTTPLRAVARLWSTPVFFGTPIFLNRNDGAGLLPLKSVTNLIY